MGGLVPKRSLPNGLIRLTDRNATTLVLRWSRRRYHAAMSLKPVLLAMALTAAAAGAQEAPEPAATVSLAGSGEWRDPDGNDDRLWILIHMACENCDAVPEDQCVDVVMTWSNGRYDRWPKRAVSPGFLFPFREGEVKIELVAHSEHRPGQPTSEDHRDDGCVAGPELAFGEPMKLDLQPPGPTVSIAGANIAENPDDDGRLWVFVYMECENCESVPENQCVDARITWDEDERTTHRLVSRAHSPGFGFPFRVGRVEIELVEHPGNGEIPVSEEHQRDCLPGPELAFGSIAQIDLHDGPHDHE